MFSVTVTNFKSKAGKVFPVLRVTFPNGYVKTVFLEPAEQFLVADYVGKEDA